MGLSRQVAVAQSVIDEMDGERPIPALKVDSNVQKLACANCVFCLEFHHSKLAICHFFSGGPWGPAGGIASAAGYRQFV
jgi:hypothetical protein